MSHLEPCKACSRHVASHEPHCPFCGTLREPSRAAPPERVVRRRTSRHAWLVGAALAASVTACGGDGSTETPTEEEPGTGGEPTSGGEGSGTADLERTGGDPPADGADAGTATSPGPGPGDVVALYGVAPAPEE